MSRPVTADFNKTCVKFEWDAGRDPYPIRMAVKMEDGIWVKFVRDEQQPHPSFERAINIICGYPQRGKHERKE